MHRDNLVVETREPALILGDQLRIEFALTVARHLDLDLAGVGGNRLSAIAIVAVASLLILPEMMIISALSARSAKAFFSESSKSPC